MPQKKIINRKHDIVIVSFISPAVNILLKYNKSKNYILLSWACQISHGHNLL